MRSPALLLCALTVSCGQASTMPGSTEASTDASVPPIGAGAPSPAAIIAPTAIGVVRAHASFAERAGVGGALSKGAGGYRLATASGFRGAAIDGVLPELASGAVRVGVPGREGAFLELVAEGVHEAPPRVVDRAIVHEDALPATDLVRVVDPSRVEELRVLRGPAAPRVASWRIRRGPEIAALRVRGDHVEALDASGAVRIESEPIVAVDADGVTRTPSIRLDGDRLIVELDADGLAFPVVLDPAWVTTTANMLAARAQPFAYKLADGRLLFLGGSDTVDVYDPDADTFQADVPAQHSFVSRSFGAVFTPLPTGKILGSGGGPATAELYDPSLLKAAATGVMTSGNRHLHTATLLASLNKVVLVGGGAGLGSGTTLATVETYDIGTGVFTAVTPLPTTRGYHVASLLGTGPNAGKILLAGGRSSGYSWLSTAELLDPATWTTTPTANAMSTRRSTPTLTLLTKGPNAGKYLIAGGETGAYTGTSTTDLYDPVTNTFSAGPPMAAARYDHAALALSDGRVVVAGGSDSAGRSLAEVFDPVAGTWTTLKPLGAGRIHPTVAELSGGRLIVVGDSVKSEIYWPDAVTCTSGATCPSGSCVDGYCCDTSCTGQCFACDVAGRKGICSPVTGEIPHGARAACSPYVLCASGACASTCASDAACGPTSFCDVAAGKCLAKKPLASGCAAANECASGSCADGYCCNAGCAGTCSACDVAGSVGTCVGVVGTPHGARSCPSPFACSASGSCATSCAVDSDCATGTFCDTSSGACVGALARGVACGANRQCQTGQCVDGYCCDAACNGSCQACDVAGKLGTCSAVASGAPHGASRSCAPYASCAAGACATGCTTSADCTTGYCSGGKCVAIKALGAPCGTGGECASGFCADAVCCDTACTSDCGACALAGLEGTCSPRPAAASCGTSGCSGARLVTKGHCSGSSFACVPGASTPCPGSLLCQDASTCKTTCLSEADCTTGACDTVSGKCTAPDAGAPDAGPEDTGAPDTFVPDTSVPDTSVPDTSVPDTSAPDTSAPDTSAGDTSVVTDAIAEAPAPKPPAHPTVDGFTRCSKGSECKSGFCVEGVCCDTACTDRCHSCALLGSPGICTPEPIGVDLRSDCGPASSCLGTCDGAGQCIGANTGTMCARNRCTTTSTGVGPAYCAAPGALCPTDDGVAFDCAPYACEPAFGACREHCSVSSDCANGFLCDTSSRQCIAPTPAADDSGCAVGPPSGGKGLATLGLVALAAALRRRRRAS